MKREVKKGKKGTVEKKKKKINYPMGQFWFNVISLVLLLMLAFYIGGRSIYYYSIQQAKTVAEAKTLATIVKKNNPTVDTGDGLYQMKEEYLFKGRELANYVEYSNRLWRIVKINENNSVQLVADSNQNILVWGDEINYLSSNIYRWLNKQDNMEHTGILFDSLNKPAVYLDITPWCEGKLENNKLNCTKDNEKDYISLLTAMDYINAKGKESYLNDGTYTWLLGLDEEDENIYLNKNGSISPASLNEGYGVKPVITIKNNIDVVDGDGTKENPYKIEPSDQLSKVNQYVKLGEDIWKIQEETENLYKLTFNQYLQVNGVDYEGSYSDSTTEFDISNRKNIGYYLNHQYLNNLSYQDKLDDCTFYTGELSDEVGYNYLNIYQKQIISKVGMLNLVDLKPTTLTDFYLMNTTSSMGEMAWIHNVDGELHESITQEKKKIVPVVCIAKDKILNGNGSIETPYIVE